MEFALFVGVDDKDVEIEFFLSCLCQPSLACAGLTGQYDRLGVSLRCVTAKIRFWEDFFTKNANVLFFAETICVITHWKVS